MKFNKSRSHTDLVLRFEILEGQTQHLEDEIIRIRNQIFVNLQSIATLHFARILILPARNGASSKLLVSATTDDPPELLINNLANIPQFISLLKYTSFSSSSMTIRDYFITHQMPPSRTFYVGNQNQKVKTIHQNKELYEECLLYTEHLYNLEDPLSVHDALKRQFNVELNNIDLKDFTKSKKAKLLEKIRMVFSFIGLVPFPFGNGAFYKFLLLFTLPITFMRNSLNVKIPNYILHYFERRYQYISSSSDRDRNKLMYYEDRLQQNQFNFWGPVKKNTFWKYRLLQFLNLSNWFARYIYTKGKLTEVPTIHFARIMTTDDNEQMLFMSDFDGSWELYLNDFVSIGKQAVLNSWNNLKGCPPTKYGDPTPGFSNDFLPYIRNYQIESLVWYSAYPNLSVNQIKKHEELVRLLKGNPHPIKSKRLIEILS
jgi:hypothetical protein